MTSPIWYDWRRSELTSSPTFAHLHLVTADRSRPRSLLGGASPILLTPPSSVGVNDATPRARQPPIHPPHPS
jgi:hypothetical protein